MNAWPKRVARRIVSGLGAKPGELIQVRDHAGSYDVLQEVLLAVEHAGATPLPEITPPDYTRRMLAGATLNYLSRWDRHRRTWMERTDRILVLQGDEPEIGDLPPQNLEAWRTATHRLTAWEEEIGPLPFLMAAIPTASRARRLGTSLEELEAKVWPAILVEPEKLGGIISRVLDAVRGGYSMTIRSGEDGRHELNLSLGDRSWIPDDGLIEEEDIRRGGVVSNLPAGSIYTTILEDETEGEVHFPRAEAASDAVFRFERGRAVGISAESGAEDLDKMFDTHSGEPRRIGHLGVGLNPRLTDSVGWTLVDAHVSGHVFVSFGENRYMGGENESSLNVDFSIPEATLEVDGQVIVDEGALVA